MARGSFSGALPLRTICAPSALCPTSQETKSFKQKGLFEICLDYLNPPPEGDRTPPLRDRSVTPPLMEWVRTHSLQDRGGTP